MGKTKNDFPNVVLWWWAQEEGEFKSGLTKAQPHRGRKRPRSLSSSRRQASWKNKKRSFNLDRGGQV